MAKSSRGLTDVSVVVEGQASAPATGTGKGSTWVKSGSPTTLQYTDSAGDTSQLTSPYEITLHHLWEGVVYEAVPPSPPTWLWDYDVSAILATMGGYGVITAWVDFMAFRGMHSDVQIDRGVCRWYRNVDYAPYFMVPEGWLPGQPLELSGGLNNPGSLYSQIGGTSGDEYRVKYFQPDPPDSTTIRIYPRLLYDTGSNFNVLMRVRLNSFPGFSGI